MPNWEFFLSGLYYKIPDNSRRRTLHPWLVSPPATPATFQQDTVHEVVAGGDTGHGRSCCTAASVAPALILLAAHYFE
jgi:hypothetical protein